MRVGAALAARAAATLRDDGTERFLVVDGLPVLRLAFGRKRRGLGVDFRDKILEAFVFYFLFWAALFEEAFCLRGACVFP